MNSSMIFLETSIQIRRILEERLSQNKVEAQIRQLAPNLCTSAYVWMEFQRTVAADYAHVQRLMLNYDSWGQVMAHLLTGRRAFRPRSAVRCTQILGLLYEESEGEWEFALHLINNALTIDLHAQFWAHVRRLPDPVVCDLVITGVTRQEDGSYRVPASCRKETASCQLPNFLAAHQSELRTLAEYLSAHPRVIKNQARLERLLTVVLNDPRAALGQSACWALGDIIIALQVPPDAAIWTLDADFKALATALERKLYTLSPDDNS